MPSGFVGVNVFDETCVTRIADSNVGFTVLLKYFPGIRPLLSAVGRHGCFVLLNCCLAAEWIDWSSRLAVGIFLIPNGAAHPILISLNFRLVTLFAAFHSSQLRIFFSMFVATGHNLFVLFNLRYGVTGR